MMDKTEDADRRHFKLRRNPYGSNHSMATLFARGGRPSGYESDGEDESRSRSISDVTDDKASSISSKYVLACFFLLSKD